MAIKLAQPFGPNGSAVDGSIDLAKRFNTQNLTPRTDVAHFTYVMDGTEAAGDKIRFPKFPQGTKILPHLSRITSDGAATTLTVDVGDLDPTADQDRYCAGANVAAANAKVLFSATGNPVADITPYVLKNDAFVEATLVTCATPVAGKKLEFLIAFNGA